jgi:SAM-dependent methyltransferase
VSIFDEWIAARYEQLWPHVLQPAILDDAVEFLADLAHHGSALEFGIGTGRIALPLARRSVDVSGIEIAPAMVAQLQAQQGSAEVDVAIGDFASVALGRSFDVVYLVRNTITNVATLDGQIAVFQNAAAHLKPNGCFVIENYIPALRQMPPGEMARVFDSTPEHLGYEVYDFAAQIAVSHHYWVVDGKLEYRAGPHRFVWPSELDLMARLAGLRLRERWSDWARAPFTADSRSHISIWERAA